MEMMDIRKIIVSFFIMLKEDTYVLIRIQALVSLVTVLFLVMIILDFFRCRNRSSLLTTVFQTVDSMSDRLVLYLLGSMQAASFENQMFPVWAVVLVSLRASIGYLSGYGIQDHHRRLTELGNVIKFMGAGVLNHTRALKFTKPLWSLWAILLARSIYRFVAHDEAITSLWHGRNAEFLPEYMRDGASDHEQGNGTPGDQGQHNNNSGWIRAGPSRNRLGLGAPASPNTSHGVGASDREQANGVDRGQDNDNNDQKYLVYGETKQKVEVRKPSYTLHLNVVDPDALITLNKISDCNEPLLSSSNSFSSRYKDMSLAFALSRLLRCRFEDVTLQKESILSTRKLITSKIIESQQTAAETVAVVMVAAEETASMAASITVAEIEMAAVAAEDKRMVPEEETTEVAAAEAMAAVAAEDTEMVHKAEITESTAAETEGKRAFRILELELAFARDYFHTLYPLVFCRGLRSLCFSLLLSMATFAVTFWLAVEIRKVYHLVALDKEDNFMLHMHGGNVDVLITWLFMLFMMFKEVWEMITYLLSNWTRLLLVCKYVQSRLWFRGHVLKECLIRSFYKSKIADAWHGCMDQYDFLQSCNYKPFFQKVAHAISMAKIPEKLDGKKSGKAIKIPECVKLAVLQALRRIGLNNIQLPREIPSLLRGQWFDRYSWACLELHTCSQVILVWHIATSLCETKLAEECEIDLTNPGFLRSAWSRLKTFSCCTSEPYLLKKNVNLQGELETNYHIATSLSRYCAYLQVFRSELLPDSFSLPHLIFGETLQDARKILKDCNLVQCRYNKLMATADEAAQKNLDMKLDMNIVQQGATLAKALIRNEDKENRWKIIAEVWADLLVHIAPSWNAADHKYYLESGGEFITLVWVLLSHCGIEKSSLWDKDEAPESNGQVPQENTTEASNNQSLEEQQVSESKAQVPQENNTDQTSNVEIVKEQQVCESNAQVPQENSTETSNNQSPEGQQVCESNAQVPPENNTDQTSNSQSLEKQQVCESNAQVPRENNTDQTSNVQTIVEQQVFECNAEIPQENNTETSNIHPVEDQSNEDGSENDED